MSDERLENFKMWAGLVESKTYDPVQLLLVWNGYMQSIQGLDAYIKKQVIAWIEANGGKLEMGDGTYYVVNSTTDKKCIDIPRTIDKILEARGGEVSAIAEYIAANGIKPGAAKKILTPDDFKELFKSDIRKTLDKKVNKSLMLINHKFSG